MNEYPQRPGFELGNLGPQEPRLPNFQSLCPAALLSLDIFEARII